MNHQKVSVSGRWMLDVQIDAGLTFFFIMKYLYIDESIGEQLYIVRGILADNERDLLLGISSVKKADSQHSNDKKTERNCFKRVQINNS